MLRILFEVLYLYRSPLNQNRYAKCLKSTKPRAEPKFIYLKIFSELLFPTSLFANPSHFTYYKFKLNQSTVNKKTAKTKL